MSKIWKLKIRINKRNKQINLSVPKRQLPKDVRKLIGKDPSLIKVFKMKFEGFE